MYQPVPLAKPSGDLLEKAISIFEGKFITHMKEEAKERAKLHDEQKKPIIEQKVKAEEDKAEADKELGEEQKEDENKKVEKEEFGTDSWSFVKCETESTFGENLK